MAIEKEDKVDRVRLTDESVANVKVANKADIIPTKGGYKVEVSNQYGNAHLKSGSGDAVYKTKASAKKVLERHNPKIELHVPDVLPSPSMRPPQS